MGKCGLTACFQLNRGSIISNRGRTQSVKSGRFLRSSTRRYLVYFVLRALELLRPLKVTYNSSKEILRGVGQRT